MFNEQVDFDQEKPTVPCDPQRFFHALHEYHFFILKTFFLHHSIPALSKNLVKNPTNKNIKPDLNSSLNLTQSSKNRKKSEWIQLIKPNMKQKINE